VSNWVKDDKERQGLTRNKACRDGKVCYPTRKQALFSANKAAKAEKRGLDNLTPYKCTDCHEWHLTSHPIRPNYYLNEYRGHEVNKAEGLWTSPSLPGEVFIALGRIREALDKITPDEIEATNE
jgi:hypothetical protein